MGNPAASGTPERGLAASHVAVFRRLCRSSPWRWQTLRFEVAWSGPAGNDGGPWAAGAGPFPAEASGAGVPPPRPAFSGPPRVRAWLRRPNALRVETLDGRLLHSTTRINASRSLFYSVGTRGSWMLPPSLTTPVYDDDGLVRRRPEAAYGDPSFGDPRWSAALDPVELAGSGPVPAELPFANVVEVFSLEEVEVEGRPALEAVVSPNPSYRPATEGHPLIGPGRTLVRVDLGTGVCVSTDALDGPDAGMGHHLRILGVDEYMLDDLFVEHSMNLTDVRRHIPWVVGHWAGS